MISVTIKEVDDSGDAHSCTYSSDTVYTRDDVLELVERALSGFGFVIDSDERLKFVPEEQIEVCDPVKITDFWGLDNYGFDNCEIRFVNGDKVSVPSFDSPFPDFIDEEPDAFGD